MTPQHYVLLGYAVALTVMWGYAVSLYLESRRLARRRQMEEGV